MKKSGQLSFSDAEHALKKKQTRRERFLNHLDQLLPWHELFALIEPHYPKSGARGQQPIGLAVMLRIHVSQIVYNYSDPGMEDALYEVASLRHFSGIGLDEVPDETTILKFRHLLEKHQLAAALFEKINKTLSARGLFLKTGTIVDASLIAAPTSTKNKENARDPDMHSSKKGEMWHFGGKVHIGVDSESGLTHSLEFTSGNVADITEVIHLLHGEETCLQGDAGYLGVDKRTEIQATKLKEFAIAKRPGKLKKIKNTPGITTSLFVDLLVAVEHELASRRAKVEHVFRDLKVRFGYAKVRYRGLMKNMSRFKLLAGIANVLRAFDYEVRKGIVTP